MLREAGKLHRQRRAFPRDRNKPSVAQMVRHLEDRLHDDPAPVESPAGQDVAVIGLERPRHLEAARAFRGAQRPLEFRRAGKAQVEAIVTVADQRIPVQGIAPPRDIAGRGAQDARAIPDKPHLQRGILERAKMEGHVQPLGHHVDLAVRQAQADVDLGVFILEFRHMRRDEPAPDPKRCRDEDRSAQHLRRGHDRGFGIVDRLQHLARAIVEKAPVLGGLQAPGRAVEQPDAQMLFQFRYPRRGDGGRGALIPRGGGHRPEFEDADEHLDIVDVGHSLSPRPILRHRLKVLRHYKNYQEDGLRYSLS